LVLSLDQGKEANFGISLMWKTKLTHSVLRKGLQLALILCHFKLRHLDLHERQSEESQWPV
jgi:hypothetical protein